MSDPGAARSFRDEIGAPEPRAPSAPLPRSLAEAVALVALVVAQAALLRNLFGPGEPPGQDLALHLGEIAQLARSLRAGDLGFWNPGGNLGAPSGYYYQLLPQLLAAVAHVLLGDAVPLLTVFKIAIAVPLVLLPVAVHRAARVAGLGPAQALGAAIAVAFVTARLKWGLGLDSTFMTGVYPQTWATLFYPLAVGYGYRYLRHGRDQARALVYALLTGLCHPFFGALLALALAPLPWWRAGFAAAVKRALALGALALAASAFVWLPVLVHFDSFGGFPQGVQGEGVPLGDVLRLLAHGDLLDGGRLPILTALLAVAPLVAFMAQGGPVAALLAQGAAFSVYVAVGPFPALRALALAQMSLAAAAGATGAAVVAWAWSRVAGAPKRARVAARALAVAASAALVAALVAGSWEHAERIVFTASDRPVGRDDLEAVLQALADRPPGRVHAMVGDVAGAYAYWAEYLPFVYAGKPPVMAGGGSTLQGSANFFYTQHLAESQIGLYDLRYLIVSTPRLNELVPGPRNVLRVTPRYTAVEIETAGYFGPIRVVGAIEGDRLSRRPAVEAWLAGPGPSRGEHLAIGGPALVGPPPDGRVLSEWEAPSRYGATVEVGGATPTTFVLRVTYHPAWSGTIDGQAAPVRRVTPDLLAIDVPPGRHEIAFRFGRPGWTWILLALTLVLLAGVAGAQRRGSRRLGAP